MAYVTVVNKQWAAARDAAVAALQQALRIANEAGSQAAKVEQMSNATLQGTGTGVPVEGAAHVMTGSASAAASSIAAAIAAAKGIDVTEVVYVPDTYR
ncbi:hypothetical protein BISA_1648 [Bifidobacterium saguini DSM 23967]|uniref:Uncharacterized protein n=3 Tax=Bifidobacterium TaxID=1678 RepID=A0A2N5ISF6_9BIFI|nr:MULTISPECIES: hypothetical protein [Bifidobacterium]KFI93826.1 hypothetical protein BISA_1648 [Bifidobacterium saguini DSM 23967]PLS24906.1 hypothetical protein Tam1G_1045 [Bifidobacterium imperatoris]QSY56853.1 hypothetical protein BLI708_06090 [Bifidobacterium imperatoris]QTB91566.1 hypothetical protein BSD967_03905 [Bifidobacterium saguini]